MKPLRDRAWRYNPEVMEIESAEAVLIASSLLLYKAVRDMTEDRYRLGVEFDDAARRLLVLYGEKEAV